MKRVVEITMALHTRNMRGVLVPNASCGRGLQTYTCIHCAISETY